MLLPIQSLFQPPGYLLCFTFSAHGHQWINYFTPQNRRWDCDNSGSRGERFSPANPPETVRLRQGDPPNRPYKRPPKNIITQRLTFLVDISSAATYDIFEIRGDGRVLWRVKDDTRELLSVLIRSFPRRVQDAMALPATSPRAAFF